MIRHARFFLLLAALLLSLPALTANAGPLHRGFAYVNGVIPNALYDVRYYSSNNFVGKRIDGYEAPRVVLTMQATLALADVQAELEGFGLSLKIFDGYRPQRAVNHFVRWAKDLKDTKMKKAFYPNVNKKNLFRDGYIASKSGHSRGSTVDLTIVDMKTGKELDMGTPFDYFDPRSWPKRADMSTKVRANRALLRSVMERHGFKPYEQEWWHFTLKNEPFPKTYFDFPVK